MCRLLGLVVVATALGTALPATAQGPIPPGMSAPNDGVHGGGKPAQERVEVRPADVAGNTSAQITVLRVTEPGADAKGTPLPDVPVLLQWRADGGKRLALSYEATTDAMGVATFPLVDLLRDTRRFELRALVRDGGVPQLSNVLSPSADGVIRGQVRSLEVTGDNRDVVGGSLVSILAIPGEMNRHPATYKYVQVQQIVELTTVGWLIFDSQTDGRRVLFELPTKAVNARAQVIGGGAGSTEVSDSKVFYEGVIFPSGEGYPPTRLMVSYFLEANGSELEFEQPMSLSFADIRVTMLRETDLPDHGLLDIELDAPQFSQLDDQAQEGVMEGRKVKVARGLALSRDDTLAFTVRGLPYPDDPIPWVMAIIAGLIMLGGTLLGYIELRRKRNSTEADEHALIDAQIEALYAGLAELERDHIDGQLSDLEYETEHARLKMRIALLMQRRDGVHGDLDLDDDLDDEFDDDLDDDDLGAASRAGAGSGGGEASDEPDHAAPKDDEEDDRSTPDDGADGGDEPDDDDADRSDAMDERADGDAAPESDVADPDHEPGPDDESGETVESDASPANDGDPPGPADETEETDGHAPADGTDETDDSEREAPASDAEPTDEDTGDDSDEDTEGESDDSGARQKRRTTDADAGTDVDSSAKDRAEPGTSDAAPDSEDDEDEET